MAASSVPAPLTIERCRSTELTDTLAAAVRTLCDAAYGTATAPFFASLGSGEHLLGLRKGALVSHLMWVTRWLQPTRQRALRTAYVEMVATDRKSTRLNSSHTVISYAVFCLKKKI